MVLNHMPKGGQKGSIQTSHLMGLSVSHARVIEVRRDFSYQNVVTRMWNEIGVVIPPTVKLKVFVTGSSDNFDISGRVEIHGTILTITAHLTDDNRGVDPKPPSLKSIPKEAEIKIPEKFANVPYVEDFAGEIKLTPIQSGTTRSKFSKDNRREIPENEWIKHASNVVKEGSLCNIPITYSGYHSHNQDHNDVRPRASIEIFPEIYNKAATMAMQKHSMEMLIKATNYANPGQIAVCTIDCPLYALQKKCQWVYPDEVGVTKIVIMLGMLHLEMATQECGGRLLGGSGWELMFLEAGIYQSGVCNSLLGGKHVKRTRYAYELTLVWLEIMKRHSYEEYLTVLGPHEPIDIWEKRLDDNCPTVNFWITVRTFLKCYLRFIRGQRTGDWMLTLDSIDDLCGYFFAFDRLMYARFTPVFLRDMACLPELHPNVHAAFMKGLFVVQRSKTKFSLIGLD